MKTAAPIVRESICSIGRAKQLIAALEALPPLTRVARVRTRDHLVIARHCTRAGERTGGLAVTVGRLAPQPWETHPSSAAQKYLPAGWNVRTLSRALFRLTQPAPARPTVLALWRRVEEQGPLPLDFLAQVSAEMERTGLKGIYPTMTEEEAQHWLAFIDSLALVKGG